MIYGNAFSPEVLAGDDIPQFPRRALGWLQRDRKEAVEGGMRYNPESKEHEHDGMGLDCARQTLRRLETRLQDNGLSAELRAIVTIQRSQQQCFVQFWEGKIWMLDRMIEKARASADE